MRIFHSLLIVTSCAISSTWPVHAKDFGTLNGITISCTDATDYRDKTLIKEFDLLQKDYENGKAARQQATQAELNKNLDKLEAAWQKAGALGRKKIAANGIGLALSIGGTATGKWAGGRPGISAQDKQAAEILADRGATLTSAIVSSEMTKTISAEDLALLPVSAIAVVTFPPAALGLTVYGIGKNVISTGDAIADYYLTKDEYGKEAKILRAAIAKIAEKAVDRQLARVMSIKKEIDDKCN